MRQGAAIFLVMMALASVVSIASASPVRSRFLAGLGPKNKKCTKENPTVCLYANSPATTCCGDTCADTGTDPLNCGKCGKICKFTDSCCGGKCVDLNYDKKNCGSCNNECKKRCFYGLCDYA